LADPVADKLLVGAALLSLVSVDRLAAWIAAVVIGREAFVSALRWYAGTEGISIHVSALGKAKTGAQMTAITALMLVGDTGAAWVDAMLAVVVTLTVASGIDYLLGYWRQSAAPRTSPVTVARW
jgi:CDP-diacylglycerol--glycerol-3-phosphate 3-phosphatidyltransferase